MRMRASRILTGLRMYVQPLSLTSVLCSYDADDSAHYFSGVDSTMISSKSNLLLLRLLAHVSY